MCMPRHAQSTLNKLNIKHTSEYGYEKVNLASADPVARLASPTVAGGPARQLGRTGPVFDWPLEMLTRWLRATCRVRGE